MGICTQNQINDNNNTIIVNSTIPDGVSSYKSFNILEIPNKCTNTSTVSLCKLESSTLQFHFAGETFFSNISPKTPILFKLNNRRVSKKIIDASSCHMNYIDVVRP